MSDQVEIEKIYDLSPMQEGMLYHSLLQKNTEAYFVQISFSIKGFLDINVFERAIKQLINRHEVLRTTFFYKNVKKPKQVVLNNKDARIDFKDLSDFTEGESSNFIKSYLSGDRKQKFDLEKDTLIRFAVFKINDVDFKVVWSLHHILLDGWSLGIVLKELFTIYESIKNDTPLQLKKTNPYKNFIDWLGEQDYEKALTYWKKFLDGYETKATLPSEIYCKESNGKQKYYEFNIGEKLTRDLILLSKKFKVTLNTTFQAIWGILLQRYTNQDDVIFGAVHSGRTAFVEGIDNMVGLFINTIPVRIGSGNTFREFATNIQEQATSSGTYSYYPLYKIQEQSVHKRNLFDHIIVFENYPLSNELGDVQDIQISDLNSLEQTNYPLSIAVYPGKSLKVKISYDEYLYDENFIFSIEKHIKQVASTVLYNPDVDVNQIDILTEQERHQLLVEFNDTEMPYPKEKTIHCLFEEQAEKDPNQVAVVFKEKQLTYKELNEQANRLARILREQGVKTEDRVGLLMERSLDMIVGMLGILKAGGAYLPIDPAYPAERIDYMLEDSGSRIVLSQTKVIDQLLPEVRWDGKCLDVIKMKFEGIDKSNLTPINHSRNLAYVIYTSGTTGKPKGVMVEHEGVANLVYHFKEHLEIKEKDRMGQFASIAFDASIEEVTKCLLNGASLYIIPKEVIYDYHYFENYINQNQITILTLPPAYLRHLNNNLDSIRHIVAVGDVSSRDLIESWRDVYINGYGPTETTIGATMWKPTKNDQYNIVPIGKPMGNKSVYILNNSLQLQPIGVFGELCIGGEGLARGYLNKPGLTKEKFVPNPFSPGEKMYRTGDLARYLPDGNIEFLGRIDQQVKIRGYRIELGEIESTLLGHPNVKDATVLDWKEGENETFLCAYVVLKKPIVSVELRDYLSQKLPAYMVPSFLEELDRIPLTSNGKIDRKALSKPAGSDQFKEYVVPTTELERRLVKIWREVLGVEQIGVTDNFFSLGGHSLKIIQLMSNIHKELQIEIPVRIIFERPTVKQLARHLQIQERVESQTIEPVPGRSYYPVSSAQKRMYVLQQMGLSAMHYNMPGALLLEGSLEYQHLERAIQKLIRRHESLRTSFEVVNGEPVQIVHREMDFTLKVNQGSEENIQQAMNKFIQPFNLEKAPLFRAELIRLGDQKHLLLIDMHHIISDGVSMGVLFNDLSSIYQGKMLPELKIHYKDFAVWEDQWIQSEGFKQQENYWLNVFSDSVPVLELPTDYPRPGMQSFEGSHLAFVLDEEITQSLKQLASETGTTLYMLLLSAYNVLLHKYTNQSDISVGTPVAGRPHPDVQSMIGMFVNTLVMRNYPDGQKRTEDLIQEVKNKAIAAYDHADYPFELLVEKLTLDRDPSRNPLFQAMFTMQNFDVGLLDLEGLQVEPWEIDYRISKFDLTLSARETQKQIECEIEYSTALFLGETIQRMSQHFIRIVKEMVAHPKQKICELEMFTEQERHQLLVEFNDTEMPYPKEKTIHCLFEEQVEKDPNQVA
ncbi:amino acid adenylation domain-containing protein, partial [Lentibacillus sp. N15]|uniref:amino acid adenylation domain-containing protein n=1 Tax=Lentibacillus songyuanensis TaxID=3136161 RepID=UPI0031BA8A96